MHRLNMTKESYIETINDLINRFGYATVTEIAKEHHVKPSSVTEMLKKLDKLGFIIYVPYKNVSLTKKGEDLAIFLEKTHGLIYNFLSLLDVDKNIAQKDACKLEHVLHGSTLARLSQFIAYVQNTTHGYNCIRYFKDYYNSNVFLSKA